MKQATLKLKSYAQNANANVLNSNDFQKRALNVLLWSLGAFVFCYGFLLGNITFNIVERKTLETSAHSLSNEVGSLELEYLSTSNKIDLSLAKNMGFVETNQKNFAQRQSLGSIKLTSNEL
jgi:hypothetical protein